VRDKKTPKLGSKE